MILYGAFLMNVVLLTYLVLAITSSLAFLSYFIPRMQSNVFILVCSWILFACFYAVATLLNQQVQMQELIRVIRQVDFFALVVDGMLCYLLFAGCLHVDIESFFEKMKIILTLAIGTTLCSFFITALSIYGLFQLLGINYPLVTCFLYSAIIAPTDPVAVLALLKNLSLSKQLYAKVASESLLNDGVGVVLFVSVLKFRDVTSIDMTMLLDMIGFFLYEGLGGLIVGILLASVMLYFTQNESHNEEMPRVNNRDIFLLLALLNISYLMSRMLHVSPPLVAVGAGLYTSYVLQHIPATKRAVIFVFWDTIDEILNYVLFFIVGFQVVFVDVSPIYLIAMMLAVFVNFIVRIVSVTMPLLAIRVGYKQNTILYKILVVGGLKGGLSLALALSVPRDFPGFDLLFDMTYAVVAFTVIVQGLSIERYLKILQSRRVESQVVI